MAHQFIFTMKELRKVVPPKREILRGIWLAFYPGAKIGVLGPNGAGKSTLLQIMAGVDQDFLGEAVPAEGVRIGHLPQEPELDPDKDVRGSVEEGVAETRAVLAAFEAVSARLGAALADAALDKALAERARLQDQIEAVGGWDLDRAVDIAMDALRVPPGEQAIRTMSVGERLRVALCRLLLQKPDLLLLDEPTNHLDAESVAWLERFLKEYPGTVVAITHDRYFLDNVAGWILELDQGKGIPWEGNYSSWLEQKQQRLAHEEKAESARQRTRAREREARLGRPEPRHPRRPQDRLGGNLRRGGDPHARPPPGPVPRLGRLLQLQGRRPAEEGRRPLRWRAQPRAPGEGHPGRRQPAPARRADQRSRRGHAPRPRRRAPRLRRLGPGDQPRPLVSGPGRDPHARLRGREPCPLVRGQLRRVRGRPEEAARGGG